LAREIKNKQRAVPKALAWGILSQLGVFTLFISCHSLWRGGWTMGPRYIVPFVPFAALGIALFVAAWNDRNPVFPRALTAGLVLLSIFITGASSLVSQGFHTAFFNPLAEVTLPLIDQGFIVQTLGHLMGLNGLWAALPILLAVLIPVWFILKSIIQGKATAALRILVGAGVLAFVFVSVFGLSMIRVKPSLKSVKALAWVKDHFDDSTLPQVQLEERSIRYQRKAFKNSPEVLVRSINHHTRGGDWKKSIKELRKLVKAMKEREKALIKAGQITAIHGPEGPGAALPLIIPHEAFKKGKVLFSTQRSPKPKKQFPL
jgi:hypothetical protein